MKRALRHLARRYAALTEEIAELDRDLSLLVARPYAFGRLDVGSASP